MPAQPRQHTGEQIRTRSSCCQGWGSGELQCGSPCKSSPLGFTAWISTWHRHREAENFLPAHLNTAELGTMGVKVSGAGAAASCPDFSLCFKSAARETRSKVRPKPEQRRHGTALQGLLLASLQLGFAGFKSGQPALRGFGFRCWRGGEGVLLGPSRVKASVGSAGKEGGL